MLKSRRALDGFVRELVRRQDAVTAIEYALIAGLVAVAIIAALGTLAGGLTNIFTYIGGVLNGLAG